MSYAICTLFEKHYHFGVAALANSLFKRGFRGDIYAGYRGHLPDWAQNAKDTTAFEWKGSRTMTVGEGVQLHFLPLDTDYHFSNYKPKFMLGLYNGPAKAASGIVYFDPDIVIKCSWDFFESWMGYGVAVVHELISNDMPATHPTRKHWEELIIKSGRNITNPITSYLNGGFCGVSKSNIDFLNVWSAFIELAFSDFGHERQKFVSFSKTLPFYCADQDALNIAAMCSECPVSEIGPEGMDFIHGGFTMSHATFHPKPWNKNYLVAALKGNSPRIADYQFWRYSLSPIMPFKSRTHVIIKKNALSIASFIGRFYRRY